MAYLGACFNITFTLMGTNEKETANEIITIQSQGTGKVAAKKDPSPFPG